MSHLAAVRSRRVLLPLAAVALGTAVLGTGAPAQAAPPASWTQLTHLINNGVASVALARAADGALHVLWPSPANHFTAIEDTVITTTGAVATTGPVVSGWSQTTVPVTAVGPGAKILALWTGPRTQAAKDPTIGVDGASFSAGTWKAAATAILPEAASGIDAVLTGAATLKNGQHVLVWTTAGVLHFAVGGSTPLTAAQVHVVPTPVPGSNGSPTVAVDPKTGAAVAAWSDSGQAYLKQLYPTPGPLQKPAGAQSSDQNPEVVASSTGGVFTAYTPDRKHVWLLRYQGKRWSVPVPAGADVRTVGLASAPGGRIWVFYGGPAAVYATRSNRELSGFEPVQTLPGPAHALDLYHLLGEGSIGPLDVFADFQYPDSRNGTYHAHVLAQLSVTAAAHQLSKTVQVPTKTQTGTTLVTKTIPTGVKVVVKVSDAGDPVPGATISGLPGGTHTTGPAGMVSLTYPPGTKGSHTLKVTKAGYQVATSSLVLP